MNSTPPHPALADEMEFTSIKNIILRYADEPINTLSQPTESSYIDTADSPPHQAPAASAAVSLLRNISRIIADDYQQKFESHIDKKLLHKIIQKKEAQGMRFE